MRLLATLLLAVAGAVAGCRTAAVAGDRVAPTWAKFFLEAAADERAVPIVLPQSGVQVKIGPKPVFAEGDVRDVDLMQVELGRCLLFQLTPAAARDFHRLSVANQGRRLVLTLNGEPVGARRLDGPIADGAVFIFVEVPDADLPRLVAGLKRSAVELQRSLARKP